MTYKTIVALLAASVGTRALAQDAPPTAIVVQQFAPATGLSSFFTVEGARLLPRYELALGIYSNFSDDPLVARPAGGTSGGEIRLIDSQFGFNATISIGLSKRFELSLDLPITAYQRGDSTEFLNNPELPDTLKAGGLGDLRIIPKILLWGKEEGLAVLFAPIFTLPTGDKTAFLGERFTFRPSLVASYRMESGYDFAANVSYRLRDTTTFANATVNDQLSLNLGAYVPLPTKTTLGAVAELSTAIGNALETSPVEGRLGLKAQLPHALSLAGGLGAGMTEGIGSPDIRLFAALTWVESGDGDSDSDGIANKEDKCIEVPEDQDTFQDDDGCPEEDNDSDGVLDKTDKCPFDQGPESNEGCPIPDKDNDGILDSVDQCVDKAEDKDNFQDTDGCPEDDNDQDKIADVNDRCPNEPEDIDTFEDNDGCPESDNDGDGIADLKDTCPLIPEDKDSFEDEDGCIDTDNDGDGIRDDNGDDKCPNEKETFNGDKDDDGCADTRETAQLTDGKIEVLEKVLFATNSDVINPVSYKLLDGVAAILKLHPEITKLRIEGHTDNKGVRAKNLDLSNRRAAAVFKYLTETTAIDAARLVYKGYGPDVPAESNTSPAGRTANRRVEFVILDKNGVRVAPEDLLIEEPKKTPKKEPKKDPTVKVEPKKDPKVEPKKDPKVEPKKDPVDPLGPKRRP
jgi:large repetitive protein